MCDDKQRITLRAGSVIFWDYKTPHGSAPNKSKTGRFGPIYQRVKSVPVSTTLVMFTGKEDKDTVVLTLNKSKTQHAWRSFSKSSPPLSFQESLSKTGAALRGP